MREGVSRSLSPHCLRGREGETDRGTERQVEREGGKDRGRERQGEREERKTDTHTDLKPTTFS